MPPSARNQLITTSNAGTPFYPMYLSSSRVQSQVHFGARPQMSSPLAATAAKLLFVARREQKPITVPPTLPPGLTIADYGELNHTKAAELPRSARWDWDLGFARGVNHIAGPENIIQEGDEESRKWDAEWWRRRLCYDISIPRPKFTPGLVYTPGSMRGVWQGRLYVRQTPLFSGASYLTYQ